MARDGFRRGSDIDRRHASIQQLVDDGALIGGVHRSADELTARVASAVSECWHLLLQLDRDLHSLGYGGAALFDDGERVIRERAPPQLRPGSGQKDIRVRDGGGAHELGSHLEHFVYTTPPDVADAIAVRAALAALEWVVLPAGARDRLEPSQLLVV